jgi:SagB-type dehydrogenase family enzyme
VSAFRDEQPLAWLYHRNTCRWIFNTLESGDEVHAPQPPKEHPEAPSVALPRLLPDDDLGVLLGDRATCRAFSESAPSLGALAVVLHSAYGVVDMSELGPLEFPDRPAPSGGGLYPLELYVIVRAIDGLDPGVYHYFPIGTLLEQLRDAEVPRQLLTYLFMGQFYAADAAAIIVTTAVPSRSLGKYGDRGYRYLLLEAGHVAQNINLAAASCGLGACNLGGFFDDELAGLLRLDVEEEMPLYATAIGIPRESSRAGRRAIA